jgi:hypothetical protein
MGKSQEYLGYRIRCPHAWLGSDNVLTWTGGGANETVGCAFTRHPHQGELGRRRRNPTGLSRVNVHLFICVAWNGKSLPMTDRRMNAATTQSVHCAFLVEARKIVHLIQDESGFTTVRAGHQVVGRARSLPEECHCGIDFKYEKLTTNPSTEQGLDPIYVSGEYL